MGELSDQSIELFAELCELDVAERERRLGELCERSPVLHRELEELFIGQRQLDTRLERPAVEHSSLASSLDAPSPDTEQLLAGLEKKSASRYRIEGELGRGGMGRVLSVWDNELGRELAMKVVGSSESSSKHGSTLDALTLARFLKEARITSRLDHPGIVPVHEMGVNAEGEVFFTMKRVEGQHLGRVFAKVLRGEDGWTQTRALGVLHRVCESMAYAHSKGVIHRDLKPANIMVGRFGEIFVMDWGLARSIDGEELAATPGAPRSSTGGGDASSSKQLTLDGDIMGTPAYMPPEQALGQSLDLGTPADVYAVGALLYHLLSGEVPYAEVASDDDSHAILRRVREGAPRALGITNRNLAPELVAMCEKAMAREPSSRYAGMQSLADDLLAYLEGRVVRAHRTGTVVELKKWVSRNKLTAGLGLAAILILLVGLFVSLAQRELAIARLELAEQARNDEAEQRQIALISAGLAERRSNELELTNVQLEEKTDRVVRLSYSAFLHAAQAEFEVGNIREAQRLHAMCPESQRNWEWDHLGLLLHQPMFTLEGHQDVVDSVAWSPDRTRIVSGARDNTLRIWDAMSGQELLTLRGHEDDVRSVAWSPDGSRIASGSYDKTVRIWDAATGKNLRIFKGAKSFVHSVAWGPDGTRIAIGSGDDLLSIWDVEKGQILSTMKGQRPLAWNPDGTRIVSGRDNALCIWDPDSGEKFLTLLGHQELVGAVAWSPDGTRIVSGSWDDTLRIWNAKSGKSLLTMLGHEDDVTSVAWSPDGKSIASGAEDNTLRIWNAFNGKELQTLRGHGDPVNSVAWNPNGTRIVSGAYDNTLRIWDALRGTNMQILEGHFAGLSTRWSSDGQRIANWSTGGLLRVWDALKGEGIYATETHEPMVWSPDGMRTLSRSTDNNLHIWNLASGAKMLTLDELENLEGSMEWSPDGMRIVSESNDNSLHIWDAATGKHVISLQAQKSKVLFRSWSPDNTRIAFGLEDNTALFIWDTANGEHVIDLRGHEDYWNRVTWSPKGKRVVSTSAGNTLRIWDAVSGEIVNTLHGHQSDVVSVAWSPDGTRIASGSYDKTLRIWDVIGGRSLMTLRGHKDNVQCVAWSPDGLRIVSGSHDKTLRIWDAVSGEGLMILNRNEDWLITVAWSPDGKRILSGTWDLTLRIWESRLEDAQPMWRAADQRRQVRPLVNALFDEHLMLKPMLAALDADHSLAKDLHEVALRMATFRGNPSVSQLNSRAWHLVNPVREDRQSDVILGLRIARAGVELAPEHHVIRGTFAWALFANDLHDEALAESEHALQLAPDEKKAEYKIRIDDLRASIAEARSSLTPGEITKTEEP